jgi:chromosome segregation ATPase
MLSGDFQMELDQINKQVSWLDEERRKDKLKIGSLEERINQLETKLTTAEHRQLEQESGINRLNNLLAKFDEIDEALLNLRIEQKQQMEIFEKQTRKRDEDTEKSRQADIRSLNNSIIEVRKELESFTEIRRNLKNRVEEELRLSRLIDELRSRFESTSHNEEDYIHAMRILEDGRRQDTKRITDLAGESSAIRKRADEYGSKIELANSAIKKIETRLTELNSIETERRQAVTNFLENQALKDVERERAWKEWQSRFTQIGSQASEIEASIQALEVTQRSVKSSQQMVDEITAKLERRSNEITEVQRLTEERFRQEWATFKADDQKRWTNYILTMDEQRNEAQRLTEKLADRVINIEDDIQEVKDLITQANELTEKRLQNLLSLANEFVSSYERSIGRSR